MPIVAVFQSPSLTRESYDVWESEEAFRKFGEKLGPVMQSIGIAGQPEVYPAHTFVSA